MWLYSDQSTDRTQLTARYTQPRRDPLRKMRIALLLLYGIYHPSRDCGGDGGDGDLLIARAALELADDEREDDEVEERYDLGARVDLRVVSGRGEPEVLDVRLCNDSI